MMPNPQQYPGEYKAPAASLLSLNNIAQHYELGGHRFDVLKSINLNIPVNSYVAITGPSGSGKSTLMNILGCLAQPAMGDYHIDGHSVTDLSEDQLAVLRNHAIGFVFQNFNLMPRLSVLDNVMLPLKYRAMKHRERQARASHVLEQVGLADKFKNLPNQLSGGQRQRVAIARALVTEPKILLGDEPTGNLDSQTTEDIMCLFDRLHQDGQTLVLVTHEADIAARCQREIRLVDGQVDYDRMNVNGVNKAS